MNGTLRLATSEDLLLYLPQGYISVATLLRPPDAGVDPPATTVPVDGHGDEELLLDALARQVDAQLRGIEVDPGCVATAGIQVASRAFVPEQFQCVLRALRDIKQIFEARRNATCELDVILFLHNLWEQSRQDKNARRTARDSVRALITALSEHDGITPRLWLLDGQAWDGAMYTIEDLGPVVKQFDPLQLPASLLAHPAMTSLYSFGARSVWFPRDQVLGYLGTRFEVKVFDHEKWIDAATLPYATVAHECADFIQADLTPIVTEMDFDATSGQRIIPEMRCPALNADRPVPGTVDEMRKVVDDLERSQLDGIQVRLVENRKTALEKLKSALRSRVDRQLDEREERAAMSVVFLELLRTSSSSSAEGDQIETGRPRTLRQAFAEAFAFFDRVAGYDSSLRDHTSRLQQRLDEQRRNVRIIRAEMGVAQKRLDGGEDGAAAELAKLAAQIEACEAEVEATTAELETAKGDVKNQDWELIRGREEMGDRLAAEVQEEVAAAGAEVDKRAAETDETRAALQVAGKALHDARSGMVANFIIFAAVLLIGGFLISWLVPPLFHAASRPTPYLWVIHTSVGATIFKIWAIVSLALVAFLFLGNLSSVRKLKRAVDQLRRQLEANKAALVGSLRNYWEAYSKRFTSRCEWIRYSHVFDTNRELEVFVDELHDSLESFLDDLRDARADAQAQAHDFALKGKLTEAIVIDRAYVDALLAKEARSVDQLAAEFLRGEHHQLSRYFAKGTGDLSVDIHADCAAKIFSHVERTTVLQAMNDGARFDISRAATALSVFLPLKLNAQTPSMLVVQGPGPGEVLAESIQAIAPSPAVVVSDDDERILLLRVAYDVNEKDVTSLQME